MGTTITKLTDENIDEYRATMVIMEAKQCTMKEACHYIVNNNIDIDISKMKKLKETHRIYCKLSTTLMDELRNDYKYEYIECDNEQKI